jgi:hypothetical protein
VTKLLSLAAAIGVSFFCVAATSAMPLAPLEQLQTNLDNSGRWRMRPWISSRLIWRLPSQRLLRRRCGGARRGRMRPSPPNGRLAEDHIRQVCWNASGVLQRSSKTAICCSYRRSN